MTVTTTMTENACISDPKIIVEAVLYYNHYIA